VKKEGDAEALAGVGHHLDHAARGERSGGLVHRDLVGIGPRVARLHTLLPPRQQADAGPLRRLFEDGDAHGDAV
jgi:hypothetical protein